MYWKKKSFILLYFIFFLSNYWGKTRFEFLFGVSLPAYQAIWNYVMENKNKKEQKIYNKIQKYLREYQREWMNRLKELPNGIKDIYYIYAHAEQKGKIIPL